MGCRKGKRPRMPPSIRLAPQPPAQIPAAQGLKTTLLPTPNHIAEGRAVLRALEGGMQIDPIDPIVQAPPASPPPPPSSNGGEEEEPVDLSDMGTCCSQETASTACEAKGGLPAPSAELDSALSDPELAAAASKPPLFTDTVEDEAPRRTGGFLSCFRGIFRRGPKARAQTASPPPPPSVPSVRSALRYAGFGTYDCQSGAGVPAHEIMQVLGASLHRRKCFTEMLEREVEMAQDWSFFYHCYNSSFLVYEVQGVLAEILYGYNCERGPLPRLLQAFNYPDAPSLLKGITGGDFVTPHANDHNPKFREGGFCGTTSIFAGNQSEALLSRFFESGYSGANAPDLRGALMTLMQAVGVEDPSGLVQSLTALTPQMSGHLLQIMVRKPAVELFAYPCFAGGTHDGSREPLSQHISLRTQNSQVRMAANPALLLHENWFRIHYYPGRPGFDRLKLHGSIRSLLRPAIPERTLRWEEGGCAPGDQPQPEKDADPSGGDGDGSVAGKDKCGGGEGEGEGKEEPSGGVIAWLLECALLI